MLKLAANVAMYASAVITLGLIEAREAGLINDAPWLYVAYGAAGACLLCRVCIDMVNHREKLDDVFE